MSVSAAFLLSGCVKVPDDLMQPDVAVLKIRNAQSRTFNAKSDRLLLQASVSVLQDMGYIIKESSSEYGVLTAVKEASAVSVGQMVGAVALAVLGGNAHPIDRTQYITATLVVLNKNEEDKAVVRTTFQRVVRRTDNSCYAETVTDQSVYREFYEKLDKALFLEINNL